MKHWHRDPAPSTRKLIEQAHFDSTEKGLRLTVELVAYPDGQVGIMISKVSGRPKSRQITQVSSLMFNNVDEAKDALDGLADRLAEESSSRDR